MSGKQSAGDNHANQLNPNNDTYWQARGEDERPDDWEGRERRDREGPPDRNVRRGNR